MLSRTLRQVGAGADGADGAGLDGTDGAGADGAGCIAIREGMPNTIAIRWIY